MTDEKKKEIRALKNRIHVFYILTIFFLIGLIVAIELNININKIIFIVVGFLTFLIFAESNSLRLYWVIQND